ncbi:MAG TPA: hypothetical protein VGG75_10245 [Trebonia sp.]
MITGVTEISQITTKQDMSRWTRAHADAPGINWSVFPGPGGTMIIVEHDADRCTLDTEQLSMADFEAAGPAIDTGTGTADLGRGSGIVGAGA